MNNDDWLAKTERSEITSHLVWKSHNLLLKLREVLLITTGRNVSNYLGDGNRHFLDSLRRWPHEPGNIWDQTNHPPEESPRQLVKVDKPFLADSGILRRWRVTFKPVQSIGVYSEHHNPQQPWRWINPYNRNVGKLTHTDAVIFEKPST